VTVYKVFHGTNLFAAGLVQQYGVSLEAQRLLTDFGKGLYLTFNFKQAGRWASVRARNLQVSAELLKKLGIGKKEYLHHPAARIPAVISWDIDLEKLSQLNGRIFPFPDQPSWKKEKANWEAFVLKCRHGQPHSYDFVYGPVAGGHFEHEEKLTVSKKKDQLSLHCDSAIQCLSNVKIIPVLFEQDYRKHEPELWRRIQMACLEINPDRLHRIRSHSNSWISSIHPSMLRSESLYYWAFSMLYGTNSLWHDQYETWLMKKRKTPNSF
jgi:Protein of unknown function (DUF3990)